MAVVTTQIVIAVASVAYQAREARKAKAKAKAEQRAAEEARKGFEITVEGQSMPLPVIYGRSKIAGARVFHNVSSNYIAAPSPASFQSNSVFSGIDFSGLGDTLFGKAFSKIRTKTSMDSNQNGEKNQFLYVQQALCQGTIFNFVDATIDDLPLNTEDFSYGYRLNLYREGNAADPMVSALFPERATARFSGVPYASMCFKLNRDEPQYAGVPEVAFFVEGNLVYDVLLINGNYVLSAEKVYSNNPALCLLDYLLNAEYGRGLELSQVDLETFYLGKQVCNTIVQTGVKCEGKIWKNKNINTRSLPLYECNMIVDTSRPVRENTIDILSCMGDADLVWSGGQYKLKIQYPKDLGDIIVSGVITDDDIIPDSITIKYPSASERMNHCTIKFADEANDFKDNSVSWPPKNGSVYSQLIAEDSFIPLEKSFSEAGITSSYHALAKAEELVRTSRSAVSYSFKIKLKSNLPEPGDVLRVSSDINHINSEFIHIREVNITEESTAEIQAIRFDPAQLAWNAKDDEVVSGYPNYDFSYPGVNANSIGFTANDENALSSSLGTLFWESIDEINPSHYYVDVKRTGDATYRHLGVTTTNQIEIYDLKAGIYEFSIRAVYSSGAMAIPAISNSIVINTIAGPSNVQFTTVTDIYKNVSGSVTWTASPDPRVVGYNVYLHKVGDVDSDFNPVFTNLGSVTGLSFKIPELEETNVIIGVTAFNQQAVESEKALSGTINIVYPIPPTVTDLSASLFGTQNESVDLNWTRPSVRSDNTAYGDHSYALILRRIKNTGAAFKVVGETSLNSYTDSPTEYGELEYRVKLVSTRGQQGELSNTVTAEINFWGNVTDTSPPPSPTDFTASPAFSNIMLDWTIPEHNVGKGHYATLLFAKEWPEGALKPSFESTSLVAVVVGATNYAFNTGMGKRWVFWLKSQSIDRGISSGIAGPVTGQTGKIGNTDLGPGIVEAQNIADNGITNQKLIPELEAVYYHSGASLPTTNLGKMINWQGKLYKWAGSAYTAVLKFTEVEGQVLADQIADAAINTAKFAQGLQPISIFATVPTVKTTDYVSVAGKLYKWEVNSYQLVMRFTELAGQIAQAQVADGAINTAKFAQGLQPLTIVNTMPVVKTTDYISIAGELHRWDVNEGKYLPLITPLDMSTIAISGTQIANATINTAKFAQGIQPVSIVTSLPTTKLTDIISFNGILYKWSGTEYTTAVIGANAVTTTTITDNAITTGKISANAVTASQIAANTITAAQIATGAINADEIAAGAVIASKISAGAITTDKIDALAVTTAKIAAGAITADKITANTITAAQIAANTLTAAQIATGAITADEIAAGAVIAAKIAAGAITTEKIDALAITSAKIAAGAITADKIAANSITASQIATDTITAAQIAAGAITSSEVATDAIISSKIAAGAITAAKIAANSITAAQIAAGTITSSELATNAVTADKIAANTITAAQIASGAITAAQIAAGAISVGSAAIANGAISNAMIANAAIDSAKIADGSITTAKIGSAQITTANIQDGAITNAKISGAIESIGYVPGTSGWRLDRNGTFEMNGSVAGSGRMTMTNQAIKVFDQNNKLRVQMGNLNV